MHLPNLGMAMVPPLRLALLMAAATMAACVPVGTPPESLWRQLAALPVLTSHAMQGRNAELLSDLAESAAESAERELVQKAADRVVTALCSNRTRTIASRLEHALVQVVPDELVITQPSAPGAAPTAGDASVPAVSTLQLGESPFDTDGAGGMGTMVLLERAWQLLPETLLQTINTQAHIPPPPRGAESPPHPYPCIRFSTQHGARPALAQALDALRELNTTALALAEAIFDVADDLTQHRAPNVGGLRVAGNNLLAQAAFYVS